MYTRQALVEVSLRVVSKDIRGHAYPAILINTRLASGRRFSDYSCGLARKSASSMITEIRSHTRMDVLWLRLGMCNVHTIKGTETRINIKFFYKNSKDVGMAQIVQKKVKAVTWCSDQLSFLHSRM